MATTLPLICAVGAPARFGQAVHLFGTRAMSRGKSNSNSAAGRYPERSPGGKLWGMRQVAAGRLM